MRTRVCATSFVAIALSGYSFMGSVDPLGNIISEARAEAYHVATMFDAGASEFARQPRQESVISIVANASKPSPPGRVRGALQDSLSAVLQPRKQGRNSRSPRWTTLRGTEDFMPSRLCAIITDNRAALLVLEIADLGPLSLYDVSHREVGLRANR